MKELPREPGEHDMCGHCGRHEYGHESHMGGCSFGGHHGYRAMTLEEEIEMLEKAKEVLKEQLGSVETRLSKLKA